MARPFRTVLAEAVVVVVMAGTLPCGRYSSAVLSFWDLGA